MGTVVAVLAVAVGQGLKVLEALGREALVYPAVRMGLFVEEEVLVSEQLAL
jgi:hypothetical protein